MESQTFHEQIFNKLFSRMLAFQLLLLCPACTSYKSIPEDYITIEVTRTLGALDSKEFSVTTFYPISSSFHQVESSEGKARLKLNRVPYKKNAVLIIETEHSTKYHLVDMADEGKFYSIKIE